MPQSNYDYNYDYEHKNKNASARRTNELRCITELKHTVKGERSELRCVDKHKAICMICIYIIYAYTYDIYIYDPSVHGKRIARPRQVPFLKHWDHICIYHMYMYI